MKALDRWFWLATLLSAAVLVTRSASVAHAHSESMDDTYHLQRGLHFLCGNPREILLTTNDPPLGQAILALPLLITGCTGDKPICDWSWPREIPKPTNFAIRGEVLYGNWLRPQTLLLLIAIWKAILVPCVALVFHWTREIYSLSSAWLAVALVLIDPTIAANVAIAAPDTLGLTGIVFACFCMWRYFEKPSTARLALMSFAIALALLMKHTAVILPLIALIYAILFRNPRPLLRGALLTLLFMWILLKFDISAPTDQKFAMLDWLRSTGWRRVAADALQQRWPLGTYIGCFAAGLTQNAHGQLALLRGEIRLGGWWYYFPVLATYKVPLGIFFVLLIGAISYIRIGWRRAEIFIIIPLLAFTALLLSAKMNYSIRHFFPAYIFMLMLASRCAMAKPLAWPAWFGVVAAAAHVASFHPDYLSYVNFPREKIWMQITDSNLDWDQATRQVGPWLDAHPQNRSVYLAPRNDPRMAPAYYLDERVHVVARGKPPPQNGLLIISPVWVCGVYDEGENPYAFLQSLQPIDTVGHSMLVYDLDAR